jgi:hypothetical protein
MPRPLPVPVRHHVFRRWQAGDSAARIAADLGLARRTVERLARRFRQRGVAAIHPTTGHPNGGPAQAGRRPARRPSPCGTRILGGAPH